MTTFASTIRPTLGMLSSRERQILQLAAAGKSAADIARTLFLSPKTVDTYRSRLMQKLDIDNLPAWSGLRLPAG
jgi:DNA-binding NarL/FixJ family response regulator